MTTPHDDNAPPAPIDTVTTADLDLVDRLDREARGFSPMRADQQLRRLGVSLLPRVARAYVQRGEEIERLARCCADRRTSIDRLIGHLQETKTQADKAERDAYACGRREAQEEAARATCAATEAAAQEIDAAYLRGLNEGRATGWREAIEEAARWAEECSGGDYMTPARVVIAAKIRRLGAVSK